MDTPEQVVSDIEDKTPGFAKRVANAIIQAFAEGTQLAPLVGVVPAPVLAPPDEPLVGEEPPVFTFDINDTLYLTFVRQVVQEVAALFTGRATHLLLRDMPHTLHVHVVAPLEVRIQRIMEERGCNRETAEKQAHAADQARESYTSRFYHTHWSDPTQYDLTIN